ncbi:MAG: glycosyltransferase family 2 protein [Bacteroidetes bacterium]|nr:glycosyltransferase family 2 protein [Bacteroidota bacterium]
MPQLSVVIITFNEEKNIERCLLSVQGIADDIVVLDSFSNDQTEAICKKYKVNFISRKWEGYSPSKNFANAQAKYDWILSLDADEALSDELKRSILDLKAKEELSTAKFNRITNYCGSWIKHGGWYPDTKIRLFDRRITQWTGIIHEELSFSKQVDVLHLKGDCLHYSYYTIEQHYQQAEKFTTIAAKDLFEQKKKASVIKLYISPVVKFFRDYIFKLGCMDGAAGFTVARISAYATYLKYKKLNDLYR